VAGTGLRTRLDPKGQLLINPYAQDCPSHPQTFKQITADGTSHSPALTWTGGGYFLVWQSGDKVLGESIQLLSQDYDVDGLPDREEAKCGTSNNSADTDDDGMPDAWECLYKKRNPTCSLNPISPDSSADADGDSITNLQEYQLSQDYGLRLDPCKADTDGDGMWDEFEVTNACLDPFTPDADADPDHDLMPNIEEFLSETNPCLYGLPLDSDSDGLPNYWENKYSCMDSNNKDDAGLDSDSDGLTNAQEFAYSTNPCAADTDHDGLNDGEEISRGTNALDPDTDHDGCYDGPDKDGDPLTPSPIHSVSSAYLDTSTWLGAAFTYGWVGQFFLSDPNDPTAPPSSAVAIQVQVQMDCGTAVGLPVFFNLATDPSEVGETGYCLFTSYCTPARTLTAYTDPTGTATVYLKFGTKLSGYRTDLFGGPYPALSAEYRVSAMVAPEQPLYNRPAPAFPSSGYLYAFPGLPQTLRILEDGSRGENYELLYLEANNVTQIRVKDAYGNNVANAEATFTAGHGGAVMDYVARWCRDNAQTSDRSDAALLACSAWCSANHDQCFQPSGFQTTTEPQVLGETPCDATPDTQCAGITVRSDSYGLAKAEWIFGPRPPGAGSDTMGPFPQSLQVSVPGATDPITTSIPDNIKDIAPNEFDIRPQILSYDPNWGAYAGRAIPDPFVAYIYYRHAFDEATEGEDGRMVPPLERIDPQHGSTVAANFSVRYAIGAGEGTVGANPWQSPSDGMNVDVWIANEADARAESFWRLGCYTQNQRLWVYGLKEVWGASKQSYRAYYWEIQNGLDPLNPYCESKGSITLVDESGQELQYLPESTDATPHYFYVKMTSPINRATVPPRLVTANIDGKLISYDAEGNKLEEKTIPLVSQSNGFHLSGKIEAIYGPADPPSVLDAVTINTVKGAPVVFTGGGGAGSKAVPTFVVVVVNSITFNCDPGIDIDDAMDVLVSKDMPAMLPEWPIPPDQIYKEASQAAYYAGTRPKFLANISVIPDDKEVRIHPVSSKCGNYSMMPTCFPMLSGATVTGMNTDVEFEFGSTIPDRIMYMTDKLWWKLVLQTGVTLVNFTAVTGPHDMYVIDRPPVDTMEFPWSEVLRYSTYILSSLDTSQLSNNDILSSLTEGLFISKWNNDQFFNNHNTLVYDSEDQKGYVTGRAGYEHNFHLSRFLGDLGNARYWVISTDCYAYSSFLKILSDSIGISAGLVEFSHSLNFKLETAWIYPIGVDFSNPQNSIQTSWFTHVTTTYDTNSIVFEPTFALSTPLGPQMFLDYDISQYEEDAFITPAIQIDKVPRTVSLD